MSNAFTPEELEKLPKWAQRKARLLNSNVHNLEIENRDLIDKDFRGNFDSAPRVFANPYDDRPLPFGEHTTMQFNVGPIEDPSPLRVRLFHRRSGDMAGFTSININANDGLIITPTATNDVLVTTDALMKGLSK